MSVRRAIGLLLLAVTLLFALASAVVVWQGVVLHRAQHRVVAVFDPAALLSRQLLSDYVNQETGERGYVITGDQAFLDPYTAGRLASRADSDRLRALLGAWPVLVANVDAVDAAGKEWSQASGPEVAARTAGDTSRANSLVAAGTGKAAFDRLRTQLDHLQTGVDAQRGAAQSAQSRATTTLTVTLVAAAALALGALVLLALAARRGVITPLARLGAVLHQVSAGSLQTEVSASGPAEIVALGRDAEAMRAQLVAQIDTAQHATEALIQQAPVVVELRQALQPSPLPIQRPDGVEVSGRMVPAEGEIAGDWWDVIRGVHGRLMLLLVDVSGHGPAAALHAVALRAVLVGGLRSGEDAAALLDGPGRQVFAERPDMFATALFVEIDEAAGELHWINAGHPPPLLIAADGFVRLLEPTGPLINPIAAGAAQRIVPFGPGDLLLAYSDGLTESADDHGDTLTDGQLVDSVGGATTADQALNAVLALLDTHTGRHRQRDDVTVLVARQPVRSAATHVFPPVVVDMKRASGELPATDSPPTGAATEAATARTRFLEYGPSPSDG